jgi:hypothetical protein
VAADDGSDLADGARRHRVGIDEDPAVVAQFSSDGGGGMRRAHREDDVAVRGQPVHRVDIGQAGDARTPGGSGASSGGRPENVRASANQAGADGGAHLAGVHDSYGVRHT